MTAETSTGPVNPKIAEARAALACWTRGQWKAQYSADVLAGVVNSLLAEIDLMEREAKALAKSAADAIDEKVRLQVELKNRGWSAS